MTRKFETTVSAIGVVSKLGACSIIQVSPAESCVKLHTSCKDEQYIHTHTHTLTAVLPKLLLYQIENNIKRNINEFENNDFFFIYKTFYKQFYVPTCNTVNYISFQNVMNFMIK